MNTPSTFVPISQTVSTTASVRTKSQYELVWVEDLNKDEGCRAYNWLEFGLKSVYHSCSTSLKTPVGGKVWEEDEKRRFHVSGEYAAPEGSTLYKSYYYYLKSDRVNGLVARLTGPLATHHSQICVSGVMGNWGKVFHGKICFPPKSIAFYKQINSGYTTTRRDYRETGYVGVVGSWVGSGKVVVRTPTNNSQHTLQIVVSRDVAKSEATPIFVPYGIRVRGGWFQTSGMYYYQLPRETAYDKEIAMRDMNIYFVKASYTYQTKQKDREPEQPDGMGDGYYELTDRIEFLSEFKGRCLPGDDTTLAERLAMAVYSPERIHGKDGTGGLNKAYPGWDEAMDGVVGYGKA